VSEQGTEVLVVIIPCFNEEEMIEETVASVLEVSARLPVRTEILLVDDGSTDATAARMEALCATHDCVRMQRNERNMGLGRSVLRAYESLSPDCWVTVIPGDNEFLFESIEEFLQVRDNYDVILGFLQNPVIRPIRRRLASHAFTRVARFLYGFNYQYLNGMKLYRAWAFKGIDVRSGGHAYTAELIAKAVLRHPRLRIGEAPFAARGRAKGSSKAVRPGSILRALRDVWVGKMSVNRYRRHVIREMPRGGHDVGLR
jgi:glycosyltransferase involved in cell wall biosynthesis